MSGVLFIWPYLGLALAVALLARLATEARPAGAPARWNDPYSLLPLLWPMYLLHQFEEHGVDLRGRHYAFLGDLCATLHDAGHFAHCPADPAFIFAVNAVGCQLTFAMPLAFRRSRPLVAACAWGVAIVNALTHIAGAIAHGAYNPGLFTSVALFVPVSAWVMRAVVRAGLARPADVARVVASGVLIHVVLMGSLVLRARGVISHGALLVINALNGLWPLALGARSGRG